MPALSDTMKHYSITDERSASPTREVAEYTMRKISVLEKRGEF